MDSEIIANIKALGIDMINEAKSGHPGIVLSSAPILYTLYANHLNVIPSNPSWYNRDRFIMSAGHGSALLYATLFMCGFDLKVSDLKSFRQLDSKTPGHPEVGKTPGVECSTGPLGQGIATSVGIALGERLLHNRYPFYQFNTYVLVGDGDLMEGISYEACSLAGTLKLNNLIVLYDSNSMTLDGSTDNTFRENVMKRFESFGFDTFLVDDGNDLDKLNAAIEKAKKSDKPSFIEIKTKLGYGSNLENTNKVHGKPLDIDDITQLKKKLNTSNEPFYVNEKARKQLIDIINSRTHKLYEESIINCSRYVNDKLNKNINAIKDLFGFNKYNILNYNYDLPNKPESTRVTNQKIMLEIARHINMFVGGSADLNSSTKAYLTNMGDVSSSNFEGRNIWFGIREHAMGAIMNGLALLKLRPFGSTFLCFSDYLKPAIRMSALMHLPVTYVFTHDSILVGEDGPTHQPVEQLVMLRSIPNLNVYRPADAKELVGCWQSILNNTNNPSSLILSRSDVVQLENTSSLKSLKGGYILDDDEDLELIIIATGSELSIAHKIKQELKDYHIRVVSMPSKEIFLNQDTEYQVSVLPTNIKKVVIEASSKYSWFDFTNHIISIDTFGKSAKADELLNQFNFDYEQIKMRIIELLSVK